MSLNGKRKLSMIQPFSRISSLRARKFCKGHKISPLLLDYNKRGMSNFAKKQNKFHRLTKIACTSINTHTGDELILQFRRLKHHKLYLGLSLLLATALLEYAAYSARF